jgi:hypothetical protein
MQEYSVHVPTVRRREEERDSEKFSEGLFTLTDLRSVISPRKSSQNNGQKRKQDAIKIKNTANKFR